MATILLCLFYVNLGPCIRFIHDVLHVNIYLHLHFTFTLHLHAFRSRIHTTKDAWTRTCRRPVDASSWWCCSVVEYDRYLIRSTSVLKVCMFVNKHKEIFDCSNFSDISNSDILKATVFDPHSSVGFIIKLRLITTEINNCKFQNFKIWNVRNIPTFASN